MTHTFHIQPTEVIIARLPKGIRTSPKIQLRTAINTLRATLLQDAETEHRKLPKDSSPNSTLIHPSWHIHIATDNLSEYVPHTYATLTYATTILRVIESPNLEVITVDERRKLF
jgi:hypothetical protein